MDAISRQQLFRRPRQVTVLLALAAVTGVACGQNEAGSGGATDGATVAATTSDAASTTGAGGVGAATGTRVDALLTAPTQSLVDQALADHAPDDQEAARVALYFAFVTDAFQNDALNADILLSTLSDEVAALASKYPSFFAKIPDGNADPLDDKYVPYKGISSTSDFMTCAPEGTCSPSLQTLGDIALDPAINFMLDKLKGPGLLGKLKPMLEKVANALSAGKSLSDAISELENEEVRAALMDLAEALLATGQVVLTGSAAAAVAEVAAVWTAIKISMQLYGAVALAQQCRVWKTAHCCADGTECGADQKCSNCGCIGATSQGCCDQTTSGGSQPYPLATQQCLSCGGKVQIVASDFTCCNGTGIGSSYTCCAPDQPIPFCNPGATCSDCTCLASGQACCNQTGGKGNQPYWTAGTKCLACGSNVQIVGIDSICCNGTYVSSLDTTCCGPGQFPSFCPIAQTCSACGCLNSGQTCP